MSNVGLIRVVTDFYSRLLKSPGLARYFEGATMDTLIKHQTAFIDSMITEGPRAGPEFLRKVHQHLSITTDHFDQMLVILEETLVYHSIPSPTKQKIMGHFVASRSLIVNGGEPESAE